MHWNVFPMVQSKISQNWLSYGFGTKQMAVTDHYLNQWWHSLVINLCVAWHQWVNSQGSCDASLHQYPRSLLAELKLSLLRHQTISLSNDELSTRSNKVLISILSKNASRNPLSNLATICSGLKRMQTFAHNVLKWIFITELFYSNFNAVYIPKVTSTIGLWYREIENPWQLDWLYKALSLLTVYSKSFFK